MDLGLLQAGHHVHASFLDSSLVLESCISLNLVSVGMHAGMFDIENIKVTIDMSYTCYTPMPLQSYMHEQS